MPAADVYLALWRHRFMIVALTALAGIAAYAYSREQPKVYQASALVRIQQRATSPTEAYGGSALGSLELGERLVQTYATIVTTGSVHDRVAKILKGKVPSGDISISASPVGNVELLWISARSEQPEVTPLVANAATIALRQFVAETGTLRDQIVVVDSAGTPSVPVLPRTRSTVLLVVLLALIFNGALALAREFFADRLPELDLWEEKFGGPVLATVPTLELKAASTVLSQPDLSELPTPVMATQSLAGPSRWSLAAPEVGGHRE